MTITNRTAAVLPTTSDGAAVLDSVEAFSNRLGFKDVGASGSGHLIVIGRTTNYLWLFWSTNGAAGTWTAVQLMTLPESSARLRAICQSDDGKIHLVLYRGLYGEINYHRFTPSYTSGTMSSFSQDTTWSILLATINGDTRYDMQEVVTQDGSKYIAALCSGGDGSLNLHLRMTVFPRTATSAAALKGIDGTGTSTVITTGVFNGGNSTNHDHGGLFTQNKSTKALIISVGFTEAEMPLTEDDLYHYFAATNGNTTWATSTLVQEVNTHPYCVCSHYAVGSNVYRARFGNSTTPEVRIDKIDSAGSITYNAFPAFTASAVGGDYSGWVMLGISNDEAIAYVTTYSYWNYVRSGSCTGGTWTLTSEPDIGYAVGFGGFGHSRGAVGITTQTINVTGVWDDTADVSGPPWILSAISTVTATTAPTQTVNWHAAGATHEALGTVAYSASGGTSVSPSYAGLGTIYATDAVYLLVHQKPTTANGGTVTTPTGYTLRASLMSAGGYGATIDADTGNTNIFIYTKDTVTGSESGTLAVTVGDNGVCWAVLGRVSRGANTTGWTYGAATGSDTSAGNVSITFGSDIGISANDTVVFAMGIPTDVTTPAQFSAEAISATGCTFGTVTELAEPDSTTGNDIGGVICTAKCTAGPSSAAAVFTATAGGTTTNVRGPGVIIRFRPTAAAGASYTMTATTTATATTASSQGLLAGRHMIPSATATATTAVTQTLRHNRITTATAQGTATVGTNVNLAPGRLMVATLTATATSATNQTLSSGHHVVTSATNTSSTAPTQGLLRGARCIATSSGTASSGQSAGFNVGRVVGANVSNTATDWQSVALPNGRRIAATATGTDSSWASVGLTPGGSVFRSLFVTPTATATVGVNASVRHVSILSASPIETVTDFTDTPIRGARKLIPSATNTATAWQSAQTRRSYRIGVDPTETASTAGSQTLRRTRLMTATPISTATNWASVGISHFAVGAWSMGADPTNTATSGASVSLRAGRRTIATATGTATAWQSEGLLAGRHAIATSAATATVGSNASVLRGRHVVATSVSTATSWAALGLLGTHRMGAAATQTATVGQSIALNVGRGLTAESDATSTNWQSATVWIGRHAIAPPVNTTTSWLAVDIDYSGLLRAEPWYITGEPIGSLNFAGQPLAFLTFVGSPLR